MVGVYVNIFIFLGVHVRPVSDSLPNEPNKECMIPRLSLIFRPRKGQDVPSHSSA